MYTVLLDGRVMADSGYTDPQHFITDAKVSTSIDGSGSFDFTIYPEHQYYDKIFKMRSTVKVYLNKYEIFFGRVLEIEDDIIEGKRNVYCEGAFSYFLDSCLEPIGEWSGTVYEYFTKVIEEHNAQVEPDRQFAIGIVDTKKMNETMNIKRDRYESTKNALEDDIQDDYDGYYRITDAGNQNIIDYVEEFDTKAKQPLEFGLNMTSLSVKTDSDDIFTILIPIGKDNLTIESVNKGSKYLVDDEGMKLYGRITSAISFDDVTDANELLEKAKDYLEKYSKGNPKSISIEAVDLSAFGDYPPIYVGNKVRIKFNQNDGYHEYTCVSIDYDLLNPESTKYEFGQKNKTLSSAMSSASSAIDENSKNIADNTKRLGNAEKDIVVNARDIEVNARDIEVNARNIEVNGERIEANAKSFDLRASNIEENWRKTDSKVTETEDGLERVTDETKQLRSRLTQAEIEIDGDEGTIGLKTLYANLDGRVTAFSGSFDTLKQRVNELGEAVGDAQIKIDSQGSSITSLAQRAEAIEDENGNIKVRVTTAEQNIDAVKGEISTKVSRDGLISEINQSAEQIRISAAKVNLDGYVTATSLAAQLATFRESFSYNFDTVNLHADNGSFGELLVNGENIWAKVEDVGSSLTDVTNEFLAHYHGFTASNGRVTIGGPTGTPGSFNIADTQFYKNGVSAAKIAGFNEGLVSGIGSVTLGDPTWGTSSTNASNSLMIKATNEESKTVNLYLTEGTWSNGSKRVYMRSDRNDGTIRAQRTISLPDSVSVSVSSVSGSSINLTITIGGKSYPATIRNPGTVS